MSGIIEIINRCVFTAVAFFLRQSLHWFTIHSSDGRNHQPSLRTVDRSPCDFSRLNDRTYVVEISISPFYPTEWISRTDGTDKPRYMHTPPRVGKQAGMIESRWSFITAIQTYWRNAPIAVLSVPFIERPPSHDSSYDKSRSDKRRVTFTSQ